MREKLEAHIDREQVGALATQLKDGSPHVAIVDFARVPGTLSIVVQSNAHSRKFGMLLRGGSSGASFTTGLSERKSQTLQLDGEITIFQTDEVRSIYHARFPEKHEWYPMDCYLLFTPSWWRFTEWTKEGTVRTFYHDGKMYEKHLT